MGKLIGNEETPNKKEYIDSQQGTLYYQDEWSLEHKVNCQHVHRPDQTIYERIPHYHPHQSQHPHPVEHTKLTLPLLQQ